MTKLLPITSIALLGPILLISQSSDVNPFHGRWDLTIQTPSDTYPSWMEFTDRNGAPQVRIVGRVSSVHQATEVQRTGSQLAFVTSEWFGKPTRVTWNLQAGAGKLVGTQQRDDGVTGRLSGAPAPALNRGKTLSWGKPEPLFDGKSLQGWTTLITEPGKPVQSNWHAVDGELVNSAPGANIRTARTFQDFKLHLEFNCPQDGNSGVYLRGRYEVQIEYEPAGTDDALHGMGSIYGFLAPAVAMPPRPGNWETLDVTLIGRFVQISRNGVAIIPVQEIPGITGGALDSAEAEPGPLYIQGDHTGGMKYRNITIAQPTRSPGRAQ